MCTDLCLELWVQLQLVRRLYLHPCLEKFSNWNGVNISSSTLCWHLYLCVTCWLHFLRANAHISGDTCWDDLLDEAAQKSFITKFKKNCKKKKTQQKPNRHKRQRKLKPKKKKWSKRKQFLTTNQNNVQLVAVQGQPPLTSSPCFIAGGMGFSPPSNEPGLAQRSGRCC